jgi:mRNA interferase HigB
MHVIARKPLKEFWTKHPDSKRPLETWFKTIDRSTFKTWNELKAAFPTVDKVGDKIVFNIGGNKYRLVTVIHFNRGKVFVRYVFTHKEYDEGRWKHG